MAPAAHPCTMQLQIDSGNCSWDNSNWVLSPHHAGVCLEMFQLGNPLRKAVAVSATALHKTVPTCSPNCEIKMGTCSRNPRTVTTPAAHHLTACSACKQVTAPRRPPKHPPATPLHMWVHVIIVLLTTWWKQMQQYSMGAWQYPSVKNLAKKDVGSALESVQ